MKKILDRINLPAKFLLLGTFALVLFILPTFLFIQTGNQLIDTKNVELSGIPVEKKVLKLLNLLQRHRAESAIAISLNKPDNAPRLALVSQINTLSGTIADDLRKDDEQAQPLKSLQRVNQEWGQLQDDINAGKLTLATSLTRHAHLIQVLLDLSLIHI